MDRSCEESADSPLRGCVFGLARLASPVGRVRETDAVPSYVELVAFLVFASFAAAAVGSFGLLAWSVWRLRSPASKIVLPAQMAGASEVVLRSTPLRIAAIWISLLLLLPLLVLAIWAVAVELSARRVGPGLAFAAIHSWLLWRFVLYGTQVQRQIALSASHVRVSPVFGTSREVPWSAVISIEDLTFVGVAVRASGLYLHTVDGVVVVLDKGLPEWEWLRATVQRLTPGARWTVEQRGMIG
jgi:hypothetical protein